MAIPPLEEAIRRRDPEDLALKLVAASKQAGQPRPAAQLRKTYCLDGEEPKFQEL